MTTPLSSRDEKLRLDVLWQYEVLDTPPEEVFDNLAALAAQLCEAPIALISLVDEKRQWFKSRVGLTVAETDRSLSFCAHAIQQPGLFIVPDATHDQRFADNPLVTAEPSIRFYAGAPLLAPGGQPLGTLCVIDQKPRELTASQQQSLLILSRQVMTQLELRRRSLVLARAHAEQAALKNALEIEIARTGASQKEDELLQLLVQNSTDLIITVDLQGRKLSYNPACSRLLAWPEKTDGLDFFAALHAEDQPRIRQAFLDGIQSGSAWHMEFRLQLPDGSVRLIESQANLIRNVTSQPEKVLFLCREVSGRPHAENLLREREEQLRIYALYSPAAVAMFDREMKYLVASRKWMENNHFKDQSFIGRSHYEMVPDIPQRWRDVHQRCLAGAIEQSEAEPFVRADGRTDWIRWEVRPWNQADGRIGGIILFYENITERKHAEQRIQQLNRTLAVLSEIDQVIVREKAPMALLQAACQIAVEKGWFSLAWIGMLDGTTQQLNIVAQAGGTEDIRPVLRELASRPDGECWFTQEALKNGRPSACNDIANDPRTCGWRDAALQRNYRSMTALPLKYWGQVVGTFNLYAAEPDFFDAEELQSLDELAQDISFALEASQNERERRRAEEELRWKTAFFEAQVESSLDAVLVVDNQGRKIMQNQRTNELWKIPAAIALSHEDSPQIEFIARQTKDPEKFTQKVSYLYAHPHEASRDLIELIDGTFLDRTSFPVWDKAGKYYGRIWVFRDVTEQRQLEEQFRQAQKMEAIGQLAGGVAHDFNNILSSLIMEAELIGMTENLPPEALDGLKQIRANADRAANLTRQLLMFSRRQPAHPTTIQLNEVISGVLKMLKRLSGEDIEFHSELAPDLPSVLADTGMIEQILLNLVINSRDAMPNGGQLHIRTGQQTISASPPQANPPVPPGQYVWFSIQDTGCGIPPGIMPHIFEPFFTTKGLGKGTGLGLATVYGIVQQHRGWIDVSSQAGQPTTFQIFLPKAEAAPEPAIPPATTITIPAGHETILVVEDEPALRGAVERLLARRGYRLLLAASGVEALQIWQQHSDEIALLLTDIVMPQGLNGFELARQLLAEKPQLKVIYTSGYTAKFGDDIILEEGVNFLQKPYSLKKLAEALQHSLKPD